MFKIIYHVNHTYWKCMVGLYPQIGNVFQSAEKLTNIVIVIKFLVLYLSLISNGLIQIFISEMELSYSVCLQSTPAIVMSILIVSINLRLHYLGVIKSVLSVLYLILLKLQDSVQALFKHSKILVRCHSQYSVIHSFVCMSVSL